MDFIGYFENLEEDFANICYRLKVKKELQKINVTHTKIKTYQSYYTEETKKIVSGIYADDIQLLGYTFDGRKE